MARTANEGVKTAERATEMRVWAAILAQAMKRDGGLCGLMLDADKLAVGKTPLLAGSVSTYLAEYRQKPVTEEVIMVEGLTQDLDWSNLIDDAPETTYRDTESFELYVPGEALEMDLAGRGEELDKMILKMVEPVPVITRRDVPGRDITHQVTETVAEDANAMARRLSLPRESFTIQGIHRGKGGSLRVGCVTVTPILAVSTRRLEEMSPENLEPKPSWGELLLGTTLTAGRALLFDPLLIRFDERQLPDKYGLRNKVSLANEIIRVATRSAVQILNLAQVQEVVTNALKGRRTEVREAWSTQQRRLMSAAITALDSTMQLVLDAFASMTALQEIALVNNDTIFSPQELLTAGAAVNSYLAGMTVNRGRVSIVNESSGGVDVGYFRRKLAESNRSLR